MMCLTGDASARLRAVSKTSDSLVGTQDDRPEAVGLDKASTTQFAAKGYRTGQVRYDAYYVTCCSNS